jgi:hypothetical protein
VKKIIIVSAIIGIIIIASAVLLNSNLEKTTEEKWLEELVVSGPFSIDKSQYNLGEKIFITVTNLPQDEKGEMIFFRPMENDNGWTKYISMKFDGQAKEQFNLYFEPRLSELKKICTANELTGTWKVQFVGTEYSNISFEIVNQTSSWDDRTFEPVC